MLLLPAAILWRTDRGLLKTVTTIALLALITVYNKWIWDAMIPGNGELAQFSGLEPSVATPWQSATALSYQLYLLLLLFVVSVRPSWRREVAADSMPSLLRTNTAS
jgi:hypothetical protein